MHARLLFTVRLLLILCSVLGTGLSPAAADFHRLTFTETATDRAAAVVDYPAGASVLTYDTAVAASIRREVPQEIEVVLPLPEGGKAVLRCALFVPFSEGLTLGRTGRDGRTVEERYAPRLRAYRVLEGGRGTFLLTEGGPQGAVTVDGTVYEVAPVGGAARPAQQAAGGGRAAGAADPAAPRAAHAVVYPVPVPTSARDMRCGLTDSAVEIMGMPQTRRPRGRLHPGPAKSGDARGGGGLCAEVAIDIDAYTLGTFGGDCGAAVEWALAALAGVHEIYGSELENLVNLSASYVHVWETTDPYAAFVGNAPGMIGSLQQTWQNTPALAAIDRDFVHLMTRRTNTGTGGIAYLDVTCNPTYGVGFSANMDAGTVYNLPTYTWNLQVVAHEIGHNFGANHTHWCGWPGGPIDNCANLEGDCTGYPNNPAPTTGTIMSYCHAIGGGNVVLEFHPTVIEYALIPGVLEGFFCLQTCGPTGSNCALYGCTDPTACNFSPIATVDDGSCGTLDACGVCAGNGTSCAGCTGPLACNYDPAATIDDGTCAYAPDGEPCNCALILSKSATLSGGVPSAPTYFEAYGELTGWGLTLNFSPTSANDSWASECTLIFTAPDGTCIEWAGYNSPSGCPLVGSAPSAWQTDIAGTYTTTVTLPEGLAGGGLWSLVLANGWSGSTGAFYSVTVTPAGLCADGALPGCTNPLACNFNPLAAANDGSCVLAGCGTCPADLDGSGIVNVGDLLLFLGGFPCTGDCPGDLDGDGTTGVPDLLLFLSAFGEEC